MFLRRRILTWPGNWAGLAGINNTQGSGQVNWEHETGITKGQVATKVDK